MKQLMLLLTVLAGSVMVQAATPEKTIELKDKTELPLVWSIPVESCVEQAVVDDTGPVPRLVAVRSSYQIQFYNTNRQVTRAIRLWSAQPIPTKFSLDDWSYSRKCPSGGGGLSLDGEYYWIRNDAGEPFGTIFRKDGTSVATALGYPIFSENTIIHVGEGQLTTTDYKGNHIEVMSFPDPGDVLSCNSGLLINDLHWNITYANLRGKVVFRHRPLIGQDISQDCQSIVGVTRSEPGVLYVLNEEGKVRHHIPLETSGLNAGVKISPDGTCAAIATSEAIYFCDIKAGKILWMIRAKISGIHFRSRPPALSISKDNNYIGFTAIMPGLDHGEQLIANHSGQITLRYPAGLYGCYVFELLCNGRFILMDDYQSLKLYRNPSIVEDVKP